MRLTSALPPQNYQACFRRPGLVPFAGLLLICFTLPLRWAEAQTSDHDTLRRLKEVDWPRAYRDQDPVLLDRILADDFRRIGSDGEWSSKADELEYVRTHKPAYDSLVFHIQRLDVYPNGLAIVAGTGIVHSTRHGRPQILEYQSTNVLVKHGGRWRAVASHTSGDRPGSGR